MALEILVYSFFLFERPRAPSCISYTCPVRFSSLSPDPSPVRSEVFVLSRLEKLDTSRRRHRKSCREAGRRFRLHSTDYDRYWSPSSPRSSSIPSPSLVICRWNLAGGIGSPIGGTVVVLLLDLRCNRASCTLVISHQYPPWTRSLKCEI